MTQSDSLVRLKNYQIENKEPMRSDLSEKTEKFLAAGNVITLIAPGVSGDARAYGRTSEADRTQQIRASKAAREKRRQVTVEPLRIAGSSRVRRTPHVKSWTADEDALLLWLRAGDIQFKYIAPLFTRIPRTVNAAKLRYLFLTRGY